MGLNKENFYILKQGEEITWNFTYTKEVGIVYRVLKENQWSSYRPLVKECNGHFQITVLENANIYLIYEDFIGNIRLKLYDKIKWSEEKTIQSVNKDMFEAAFNLVSGKGEVHIIYNILNKKTDKRTLFHQKINEADKLSDIRIIDNINFNGSSLIVSEITKNNELIITYERLTNDYEIGYKILNTESETLSGFHIIDKSKNPFTDYSFLSLNNIIYTFESREDKNIKEIYKKLEIYEEVLSKKNEEITGLKYDLEKEKEKRLLEENKLNNIKNDFNKFNSNKKLLNENINFLQESLIAKEEKVTALERINIEKEKEISTLNEEVIALKEKVSILNSPLKSFLTEKMLNKR